MPTEGAIRLDHEMDSIIDSLHYAAPEMWKTHLYTLYTSGFEDGVEAVLTAWEGARERIGEAGSAKEAVEQADLIFRP